MRILQVTLAGASAYELKSQRIDRASLEARGDVVIVSDQPSQYAEVDLAHVYGPAPLPRSAVRALRVPYVANAAPAPAGWKFFDRAPAPAAVVGPREADGVLLVPEAVEETWFDAARAEPRRTERKVIGSFAGGRPWVRQMAEQSMTRLHRFRDDVEWRLFDEPPTPADLTGVDTWADPARDDRDADGFVAEALVIGTPVVAARTSLNEARTDKGRTALLAPAGDPNELVHAILAALFKPEVALQKVQAARLTASKFRPGRRLRVLVQTYETLTP